MDFVGVSLIGVYKPVLRQIRNLTRTMATRLLPFQDFVAHELMLSSCRQIILEDHCAQYQMGKTTTLAYIVARLVEFPESRVCYLSFTEAGNMSFLLMVTQFCRIKIEQLVGRYVIYESGAVLEMVTPPEVNMSHLMLRKKATDFVCDDCDVVLQSRNVQDSLRLVRMVDIKLVMAIRKAPDMPGYAVSRQLIKDHDVELKRFGGPMCSGKWTPETEMGEMAAALDFTDTYVCD